MPKKSAGGFDAQGQRVLNVATPAAATDAMPRAYVDALGVVKSNYAAATAPTAANDSSQGYAVGSPWMIASTGESWQARSVTLGAARWLKLGITDHPGYVPGRYYLPGNQGVVVSASTGAAGRIFFFLGTVLQRITISQLGARVVTTSAGGSFQLAIYNHNQATGNPGTLVAATGSGVTDTADLVNVSFSANQTIEPGNYWFGLNCDNGTATFFSIGGISYSAGATIGSATAAIVNSTTGQLAGVSVNMAFGTWASDLTGQTFTERATRVPIIQFLVASVP